MARRSTAAVTDAAAKTPKASSKNKKEDTVTAVAEPETAAVDEATTETEVDEVEAVDTSAVKAALDQILAGDLSDPTKIDFSPVVAAYAGLNRKSKSAATREMNDESKAKVFEGAYDVARVILLAEKATKVKPASTRAARTPADPTADAVEKLAAFQLAFGALSTTLPEGVAEDWRERVESVFESGQAEVKALVEWMHADEESRGVAPEVSPASLRAVKIAFGNPFGKRDVGKHIAQVFESAESGTFMTVAQVASSHSAEYGNGPCTIAAVNARLDGKRALPEGLSITEQDGKRGIIKN